MPSRRVWLWLIRKELRELATSRSYWVLLIVVGALVGHAFLTSTSLYAEMSGIGGGPAALAQGLSPLEGIVVPTFGAYDLAATLLYPFVVIRLIAVEKQSGALTLMLQAPAPFRVVIAAKGVALVIGWLFAGIPGLLSLAVWRYTGGHLDAPETLTVLLGHLLRGMLTIGIGAAAGALASSAASAAIVALTVTLGTWALDYVAAARGGLVAAIAEFTPSSVLRTFEHGELRLGTIFILLILGIGGLAVAVIWMREERPLSRRIATLSIVVATVLALCTGAAQLRASRDMSENRRNSFSRADEIALKEISSPLHVTVYLAAEDPRLTDMERGVFSKLRRTLQKVDIDYAARGRSGLFERGEDHYGEVWYELNGRRVMSRSASEPIILETIYEVAGIAPPAPTDEAAYPGYPLARQPSHVLLVFFMLWPTLVAGVWWMVRPPASSRRRAVSLVSGA